VIYYINFTFDVFPQLRNVKENTTMDSPANGEGKVRRIPGQTGLSSFKSGLVCGQAGETTGQAG
jgi:hypothetical protein